MASLFGRGFNPLHLHKMNGWAQCPAVFYPSSPSLIHSSALPFITITLHSPLQLHCTLHRNNVAFSNIMHPQLATRWIIFPHNPFQVKCDTEFPHRWLCAKKKEKQRNKETDIPFEACKSSNLMHSFPFPRAGIFDAVVLEISYIIDDLSIR